MPFKPFLEFELQKEYIQEVLCVNKQKPITECGGHCYLSKRLKESNETEQTPVSPQGQFKLKDYPIGFVKILSLEDKRLDSKDIDRVPYLESYQYISYTDFFHPPIHQA